MIVGKIIGAILGYLVGGVGLALLGLVVGHLFDVGYTAVRQQGSPAHRQRLQECFFRTAFTAMGHLAKADGRVSEEEVSQTEAHMARMGLTAEHRREAIRLFKEGAEPGFDLNGQIREFRQLCGRHPNLVQMLLVYLITVAMADGHLDEQEYEVLRQIAATLGIPQEVLEKLLQMSRAQDSFGAGGGAQAAPQNQVKLAYEALGVSEDANDAQVKRAYRKLMSQYHPDKLTGQGLPDDMVEQATERSQEIQRAYDTIRKARGHK